VDTIALEVLGLLHVLTFSLFFFVNHSFWVVACSLFFFLLLISFLLFVGACSRTPYTHFALHIPALPPLLGHTPLSFWCADVKVSFFLLFLHCSVSIFYSSQMQGCVREDLVSR